MVDLPKVPNRIVTAEAPSSTLTRADLMSPYGSMVEAMGEVSKGLSEFAEARAPDAAAQAVRNVVTNPDGTMSVQRTAIPMVGAAGKSYEQHIRVGAVANADSQSDQKLLELREAARGDPAAFLASAKAFRDQHVANWANVIGDAGQQALGRQIDNRTNTIYGSLLAEHQHKEITRADHAIVAQITTMADEMESLARRGGIGPDYEDRLGNIRMLLEQRVRAPNSTYSAEQANAFMDALNTRVQGAAIHEQMERVYRAHGFEAAREYLRTSTAALDGKVKQLATIERTGLAWLRAEEQQFRGERDAISREWATAKPQVSTLPRDSLIAMRDQAAAVGNTRVASDITAHLSALDHLTVIRQLPPSDRTFVAVTGVMPQNLSVPQREVVGAIEQEARRQGVDPSVATAIAWRESRLNPAASPGQGQSALGIFQLQRPNRQRLGVGDDAPVADQVRAGVTFIKETTDQLTAALGRAPTPAEIYIGHFQGVGAAAAIIRAAPDADLKTLLDQARPQWRGPQGQTWGEAVLTANPVLRNIRTAGEFRQWAERGMGSAGGTDLTETRGGLLALRLIKQDMAKELADDLKSLRERVNREEVPDAQEVAALAERAAALGTEMQKREAAELVAISRAGQQFAQLPAARRAEVLGQIEGEMRDGAARFDARLRATLRKTDRDITEAYRTDPYGAAYRFSRNEALPALPAINWGNPNEAHANLIERTRQQGIIRAEQGIGPFSALRPAEAESLRGVLASGDARAVAGVFDVLNRLPDDILAATLRDDKVKAGIANAIHTTDPAKYNAVMGALNSWYTRDPISFSNRFGPDAWNALKSWQSNHRYMTPEALAEELRTQRDPQAAEQRKHNMQVAQTLARQKTPDQVVADIGTGWLLTPGIITRNVSGSEAHVPVDGATRDALMGDYESAFERRYAETRDAATAHQQTIELLRTKWARSDVNGGRLMLRAPEQVYPAIDGGHAWMRPQIEAAIAQQTGVARSGGQPTLDDVIRGGGLMGPIAGIPAGIARARTRANWDYTLIPDRRTDQEAGGFDPSLPVGEGNRAPSYLVMWRDNRTANPQWMPLRGGDNQMLRFSFDPAAPTAAAREAFGTRRTNVLDFQKAQGAAAGAAYGAGLPRPTPLM